MSLILDRALTSPRGLRLTYNSEAEATAARFSFYRLRERERKRNSAAGLESTCEWDSLTFTLEANTLLIRPITPQSIEEL